MNRFDLTRVVLLACLYCCSNAQSSDSHTIRLVGGIYGNHSGRVEVLYNNTWGAVCSGTQTQNRVARTACRQLGYPGEVCYSRFSSGVVFGARPENGRVWMNNVECGRSTSRLDLCTFDRPENSDCTGGQVQVVCQSYDILEQPSNMRQVDASSATVTVEWTVPVIPERTQFIRHRVFIHEQDGTSIRSFLLRQVRYSPRLNQTFSVVVHSLDRNTTYDIRIRTEIKDLCSTAFTQGRTSSVFVRTAEEKKQSELPIRLIPPGPNIDFMGRVEVFYNNTWGTVCDDAFGTFEANVICQSLNFMRAVCYVREAGFGQGTGPIWMDNVDCSHGHEVLEDCDFNGWGDHNCRHDADIGVICLKDDHQVPVQGLVVDRVGATSVTLSWNVYQFPPQAIEPNFSLLLSSSGGRRSVPVPGTETSATVLHLDVGTSYSIQIRAEYQYSYCNVRPVRGEYSSSVEATTMESAPTAPPSEFHVVALNNTALEFQWGLPRLEHRNGLIQGYKLYLRPADQQEMVVVIASNVATEYIFVGLSPSTAYTCSILAFTSGDGPRSVYITVITPNEGFVSLITGFGLNGDGYDRAIVWPGETDIRIHCTHHTSDNNTVVTWYTSSGTAVGTSQQNLRQVSDGNSLTLLQIASSRPVQYCDAGMFYCEVNSQGQTQRRDFTLIFSEMPPEPSSPRPLRVTSTAVVLEWDENPCDGGHRVSGFTILYREAFQDYLTVTNMYIFNINPDLRNYTVTGLKPYTSYNFSIQAISADYLPSIYSVESIITTLAEGPSPPRSVEVRVSAPYVVEIKWREPAESNGIITAYTVYVTQQQNMVVGVRPSFNPVDRIIYMYPGSTGSVNINVSRASVSYEFSVSATVIVGSDAIEGEMSQGQLVYVPNPDIPSIEALHVLQRTNSSISLAWNFPSSSDVPIEGFQVTHTSTVEWTSKEGYLVMFSESNEMIVPLNSAQLTVLTPSTLYHISVSVMTSAGPGDEETIAIQTKPSLDERLVYFQIMLGPIESCTEWKADTSQYIQAIHTSLLNLINTNVCSSCGLEDGNVRDEELSCRGAEDDDQIIFRSRIVGTESQSATQLVTMISDWVKTGRASILVNSARLQLNPDCETSLDSLLASDCLLAEATHPNTPGAVSTSVISTPTLPNVEPVGQTLSLSPGVVGGLIVGCIIAILLVVCIVLLVVVLLKCFNRGKQQVEEDSVILTSNTLATDNPMYASGLKEM